MLKLLEELDHLPHYQRVKRVTLLAQEMGAGSKLEELMDSLTSSPYEWHLRLSMAVTVSDVERVLSGFNHPTFTVRQTAARFAVRLKGLKPQRLLQAIPALDQKSRRSLIETIRRRNRTELAMALFPLLLAKYDPKEAALILAATTPETVKKHLPDLVHKINSWTTLAGRYPDVVLDFLRDTISPLPPTSQGRQWANYNGVLKPLILKRPAKIVRLILDTSPAERYPWNFGFHWGLVTRRLPKYVVELLALKDIKSALPHRGLPQGFTKAFRFLDPSDQAWIAKSQCDNPRALTILLEALPPSQRETIFKAALQERDTSKIIWNENFMRVLPHSLREAEAHRMLGLRAVQEHPNKKIQTMAFLPPSQAMKSLSQEFRSPQSEERAAALASVVKSTSFYKSGCSETLKLLERLKNEQDPVRMVVLYELAKLSGHMFKEKDIASLQLLSKAVVEARDSSSGTLGAVSGVLFNLLRCQPVGCPLFEYSIDMLEKIGRKNFQLHNHDLRTFEPERFRAVVHRLLPLTKEAMKRGDFELLFSLANCDQSMKMIEVQDLLEKASETKPDGVARRAICLWLQEPSTRDLRVEKLLAQDPSVICLLPVLYHVHEHRQDLLDLFLESRPIKGRFLDGRNLYLLPIYERFERWLPRQQRAFALQLLKAAEDKMHDLSTRIGAINRLGYLPEIEQEVFKPFLCSSEQIMVEAALTSVIEPEPLLQFLNSDPARVAVFALGNLIRQMPPEHHPPLFERALSMDLKVTARKELVRMLGQCRGPHSLDMLQKEWQKKEVHRDVKIAILHALRQLLDLPQAWSILEQAAKLSEPNIGRSLMTQSPRELKSEHQKRYLDILLSFQHSKNAKLQREFWFYLPPWLESGRDKIASAAANCVADINRPDWQGAARLVSDSCRDGKSTENFYSAAKELFEQTPSDPEALAERDRPARQRLDHITNQILAFPERSRERLRSLFLKLTNFAVQPEMLFRLQFAGGKNASEVATECDRSYEQTRGLLIAFRQEIRNQEPPELLQDAEEYAAQQTSATRLLALECLNVAGPLLGWNETSRKLIAQLRKDPEPNVALAAQRIVVIGEG